MEMKNDDAGDLAGTVVGFAFRLFEAAVPSLTRMIEAKIAGREAEYAEAEQTFERTIEYLQSGRGPAEMHDELARQDVDMQAELAKVPKKP